MPDRTDSFTRANSGDLGSNWGVVTGFTSKTLAISSNQVGPGSSESSLCFQYWSADTFANDQYSEAKVLAISTSVYIVAVTVRSSSGALTQYSGGFMGSVYGDTHPRIWKWVSGSRTDLAVNSGVDIAANDVIRLEVSGTGLTLKVNGVSQVTTTDSSVTSGKPGLEAQNSLGNGTVLIDDWAGGDGQGGIALPVFMNQYRQRWR